MADFTYSGSGTLNFSGEAFALAIDLEHVVGDVVYIRYKIIRYQKLEQVAIKKILINYDGYYTVVYIDTYNRAWLDGELLKEDEALELLN